MFRGLPGRLERSHREQPEELSHGACRDAGIAGGEQGDGRLETPFLLCNELPDLVVPGVCDKEHTLRIDANTKGLVETGGRADPIRITGVTRACDRAHGSIGRDHPDQVILGIGDIQVAIDVYTNGAGLKKAGDSSRTVLCALAQMTPRDRRNLAVLRYELADPLAIGVGDIKCSLTIRAQTIRIAEHRLRADPIRIAAVAWVAGDIAHRTCVNIPDDAIACIRDIKHTRAIRTDPCRKIELSLRNLTAIITLGAAGDGGDATGRGILPDAIVPGIAEINRSLFIDTDPPAGCIGGQRADHTRGGDLSQLVVAGIGNIEIAGGIVAD